ncbi:MAG: hypothetical protein N0A03_03065 [Anaerolineae bacterium]|nr:hypothetical protein [Anaerolineae bacterium]
MKRGNRLLLPGVALLAFWTLALRGLGTHSFWYDEIFNADLALNSSAGSILHVLRTAQPYPPLYLLLLKGWVGLTGARPYAPGLEAAGALETLLRFPSVAAAALTLALLAPLGRRIGGPTAWVAPYLLAFHPTLLAYTRDARMYPLWSFWLLLALLGLTARRPGLWLLGGTAALLTHYFSLFPLGAAALVVFLSRRFPGWKGLLWLAAPFVPAALWGLWALPVTAGFGSFATAAPPTFAVFLREMGPELMTAGEWLTPLAWTPPDLWGYGGLALGTLGLLLAGIRSPRGYPVAGALILGGLTLFAFWQFRPVYHTRYLFWALPLVALGLVALLGEVARPLGRYGGPVLTAGVAAAVLLWSARATAAIHAAPRTTWYPDFRQAAALINARARPEDRGLTVAAHGVQALQVYRTVIPFAEGPGIGQLVLPEDGALWLDRHRPSGDGRYWLLLYQDGAVDPGGVIVGTLEEAGGYRVEMLYSHELRLYAYALPEEVRFRPLMPEREIGAHFEGGIVLRGATVHREDRLVPVYLFWELTAPQSRGLTGAVHLVRQAGERPITQQDKPVLNEYWPLPRLPVGRLLADRYELIIPSDLPAGTYTLFALLYDPETGRRCLIEGGGEMVNLGAFSWP